MTRKSTLSVALIVSTTYSFFLFLVLVGCKEALRLFSASGQFDTVVHLNFWENLFFNFFIAWISLLYGRSRFFETAFFSEASVPLYKRIAVYADHNNPLSNFFRAFSKLVLIWSLFLPITQLAPSLHYFQSYWWLFILLILALFYSQINKQRLFYRGVKWLSAEYQLTYFFTLGLVFSMLANVIFLKHNNFVNSKSLTSHLALTRPPSRIAKRLDNERPIISLYWGWSLRKNQDLLLTNHRGVPIVPTQIRSFLAQSVIQPYDEPTDITVVLNIDRNVPFDSVNRLLGILRQNQIRRVMFSTSGQAEGIATLLSPPCEESSPEASIVVQCEEIRANLVSGSYQLIAIRSGEFLLQSKGGFKKLHFEDLIEHQMKSPENGFVLINEESTYADFIKLFELMIKSNLELRKASSLRVFKEQYQYDDPWRPAEINQYMSRHHPLNIFIPNDEEIKILLAETAPITPTPQTP
ncbi:MAG: ExbD/TolR family protein [Cyclobacteriaceae bacterium]|jgi:biopolymer transport protein ExbD